MKKWMRFFCAACSLFLLSTAVLPAAAAEADDGVPYTYTVRIFAGQRGTYRGQEAVVYENLAPGTTVDFRMSDTAVSDNSKYYVKGIRESGKDSNTSATSLSSFIVTGDMDFVISYGILGDMTSYTIEYVDEDGDALAPGETYYGNVGDKPVIAYLYIDGYRPQAYNLTKTLQKDAAENIFRFVYVRGAAGGGTAGGTETPAGGEAGVTVTDTGTVVEGGVPGGAAAGEGAAGAGGGAAGADAGDAGAAGADAGLTGVPDENTPLADEPEQVQDLDEDVPLSGLPSIFNVAGEASLLGVPVPVVAGSCLILAGGGIWCIWTLKKRRKKEESQ